MSTVGKARRTLILPCLVLGAGIIGAGVALLLQWWANAVNYPFLISGKPLFSLPANIAVSIGTVRIGSYDETSQQTDE